MRLFHVSGEPDIRVFVPRLPARKDLDPTVAVLFGLSMKHACRIS